MQTIAETVLLRIRHDAENEEQFGVGLKLVAGIVRFHSMMSNCLVLPLYKPSFTA